MLIILLLHSVFSEAVDSNAVDIFNVTAGTWTTAALREARANLAATSLPNAGLAIFAGGSKSTFINFSDLDRDRGFV